MKGDKARRARVTGGRPALPSRVHVETKTHKKTYRTHQPGSSHVQQRRGEMSFETRMLPDTEREEGRGRRPLRGGGGESSGSHKHTRMRTDERRTSSHAGEFPLCPPLSPRGALLLLLPPGGEQSVFHPGGKIPRGLARLSCSPSKPSHSGRDGPGDKKGPSE